MKNPKVAIPIIILAIIAIVITVVMQSKKAAPERGFTSPEDAMKMPIPGSAPIPGAEVPAAPQPPQ